MTYPPCERPGCPNGGTVAVLAPVALKDGTPRVNLCPTHLTDFMLATHAHKEPAPCP